MFFGVLAASTFYQCLLARTYAVSLKINLQRLSHLFQVGEKKRERVAQIRGHEPLAAEQGEARNNGHDCVLNEDVPRCAVRQNELANLTNVRVLGEKIK